VGWAAGLPLTVAALRPVPTLVERREQRVERPAGVGSLSYHCL
jgi:hypothetical protein